MELPSEFELDCPVSPSDWNRLIESINCPSTITTFCFVYGHHRILGRLRHTRGFSGAGFVRSEGVPKEMGVGRGELAEELAGRLRYQGQTGGWHELPAWAGFLLRLGASIAGTCPQR